MTEFDELNKEFECSMKQFERAHQHLNYREKSIATEWIKKLKKANSSVEDLKLRLDFIDYFINCSKCSIFSTEPFNKVPHPNAPLQKLRNMLVILNLNMSIHVLETLGLGWAKLRHYQPRKSVVKIIIFGKFNN